MKTLSYQNHKPSSTTLHRLRAIVQGLGRLCDRVYISQRRQDEALFAMMEETRRTQETTSYTDFKAAIHAHLHELGTAQKRV
jgi:hypothetical protein